MDRLCSQGDYSQALMLNLAKQIAGAMDAIHTVGVLHLDLHPGNVRLAKTGALPGFA